MPKYDYHCPACDKPRETAANGEQYCPVCGALMTRLWSPIAFIVEDGTGAYAQQRKDQSRRAREKK